MRARSEIDAENPGILTRLTAAAVAYSAAFCKFCVQEFLARGISKGSLTFIHEDGTTTLYGEPIQDAIAADRPHTRITIKNGTSFYARIAATADIGFAEAFMAGDFVVDMPSDLMEVFKVLILNRDANTLSASGLLLSRLGAKANAVLHWLNRNTLSGSARNISAHYDLSNELFGAFLGETWIYSCAHFGEGGRTLDEAQTAKIEMILRKARLTRECHLLDIGCGWGELAIQAARSYGCRVTGITLSREQLGLAKKRAAAAGVSDRVEFELVDYRVMVGKGRQFDRVVSVEMIEAVGHEFLGEYFEAIDRMVKREGIVVVQAITMPEQRYREYLGTTDFIQKYIFPGGICPSLEAIVGAVGSNSGLCVEEVENIGVHYATTLREWRRRFLERVGDGRSLGFDEWFVRKWVYYFCYCEAGFATRTLGVLQIVLSRSHNTETLGEAPVARIGE